MKKILTIVSVLGLLLSNNVSADIISPGPVSTMVHYMGFTRLALLIHEFKNEIFWAFVAIFISLFIVRKIEKRIKDNKIQKNQILK